jgi:hypothetical protein
VSAFVPFPFDLVANPPLVRRVPLPKSLHHALPTSLLVNQRLPLGACKAIKPDPPAAHLADARGATNPPSADSPHRRVLRVREFQFVWTCGRPLPRGLPWHLGPSSRLCSWSTCRWT